MLIMFMLSEYRSAGIGATFAGVGTNIFVSGTGDRTWTTLRRRRRMTYKIPPMLIATIAVPPIAKPIGNARLEICAFVIGVGVGEDGFKFASKFE